MGQISSEKVWLGACGLTRDHATHSNKITSFSKADLKMALKAGVYINIDNEQEAAVLDDLLKGPCTYDVRREGGSRITQFCGQTVLIGCVKSGQREGRGSKKVKNLRDIIYGWSLMRFLTHRQHPILPPPHTPLLTQRISAKYASCVL